MAKRLLIMALVAVQSASWSGASLFLCLGADGSVCIDGGPDTCVCCHEEESGHACCHACDAVCGGHHHDSDDANVSHLTCDPCDCLHVQISMSQGPTMAGRPAAKTDLSRAAALFAPLGLDAISRLDDSNRAISHRMGGPPLVPSLALTMVTVAVRTC